MVSAVTFSIVATESADWAQMKFGALVLSWLLIVVCCARWGWKLTANLYSPTLFSARHFIRLGVRSFTLSLVFVPTLVFLGFSGFPAPATLVIFLYAVSSGRDDYDDYTTSFIVAMIAFLLGWLTLFAVALIRLASRLQLQRQGDNLPS